MQDHCQLTIRRIGNSLGVIIPRTALSVWGVGEGDALELTDSGIAPGTATRNKQVQLDRMKRLIALEVLRRHTLQEIRARSIANLERWKASGVWYPVHDEWMRLVRGTQDGSLLSAMLSDSDEANRLRQSPPYTGLLPAEIVEGLREEAAR